MVLVWILRFLHPIMVLSYITKVSLIILALLYDFLNYAIKYYKYITMCGTFTAILGEALALGIVDGFISPSIMGMGEMKLFFDFILKGIATFWVYKWAQCKPDHTFSRRPLQGTNFLTLFFGGLIGAVTLLMAKSLLPRQSEIFRNDYMGYVIDAVIVNFVYGMASSTVESLAP